ncbi:hypothetical protein DL89DRAFT_33268 [Linderina pennispora]|uniref:Transcription regulator Rua1 C-terminal domain-containing protein n=1 Tax=Linderina pennispora TaxID=61395 RepID=A0A1Y1W5A9_9FUNG|nr:uncharacterized protein DL89DRAFT_33268 [Linderina pennispora]ORX68406.1 hypothetical protein DL89DRAFT_33268 [Linderina pennispora]
MYIDEDSEADDFHDHQGGEIGRECDSANFDSSFDRNQYAEAYDAERSALMGGAPMGGELHGIYGGGRDAFSNGNGRDATNSDDSSFSACIDFSQCERNETRGPDDLYTPCWIRGIGKEKEGLCPMCYREGKIGWKRLKCSAYW